MKLFARLLSFVILAETEFILNKLRIHRFNSRLSTKQINQLMKGFFVFKKLEPKLAWGMVLVVKKYEEQYHINKFTRLDKESDLSKIYKEIDALIV